MKINTVVVLNPVVPHLATHLNLKSKEGQVLFIDPRRIKTFSDNPRKNESQGFSTTSIQSLATSIRVCGQTTSIIVYPIQDENYDAELVDGERRHRACLLGGMMIRAEVRKRPNDPEEHFVTSVVANFGREPHTCLEVAQAIGRIRKSRSVAEIAEFFGKSTPWVYQHLSLLELAPEVQRLLVEDFETEDDASEPIQKTSKRVRKKGRKLSFQLALLIVSHPPEKQVMYAEHILKHALSTTAARRYIFKDGGGRGVQGSSKRIRSLSERFDSLSSLTDRTADSFGIWLDMRPTEIRSALANLGETKRIDLQKRMELLAQNIQGLAGYLK